MAGGWNTLLFFLPFRLTCQGGYPQLTLWVEFSLSAPMSSHSPGRSLNEGILSGEAWVKLDQAAMRHGEGAEVAAKGSVAARQLQGCNSGS